MMFFKAIRLACCSILDTIFDDKVYELTKNDIPNIKKYLNDYLYSNINSDDFMEYILSKDNIGAILNVYLIEKSISISGYEVYFDSNIFNIVINVNGGDLFYIDLDISAMKRKLKIEKIKTK